MGHVLYNFEIICFLFIISNNKLKYIQIFGLSFNIFRLKLKMSIIIHYRHHIQHWQYEMQNCRIFLSRINTFYIVICHFQLYFFWLNLWQIALFGKQPMWKRNCCSQSESRVKSTGVLRVLENDWCCKSGLRGRAWQEIYRSKIISQCLCRGQM